MRNGYGVPGIAAVFATLLISFIGAQGQALAEEKAWVLQQRHTDGQKRPFLWTADERTLLSKACDYPKYGLNDSSPKPMLKRQCLRASSRAACGRWKPCEFTSGSVAGLRRAGPHTA